MHQWEIQRNRHSEDLSEQYWKTLIESKTNVIRKDLSSLPPRYLSSVEDRPVPRLYSNARSSCGHYPWMEGEMGK